MKIWNSFGSEHSAKLVMIGRFKDVPSAEKAMAAIDEFTEFAASSSDEHAVSDRYSDGFLKLLEKVSFHSVAPTELEQFRYDVQCKQEGNQIVVTTDEPDVSAFLKLMIEKGARVEVYSAHDYPDTSEKAGN